MHTDLSFDIARELIQKVYFAEIKNKRINRYGKQEIVYRVFNDQDSKTQLREILEQKYNEGYGFKLIVKKIDIPEFTYSRCRKVLKDLGIELRTGYNVITDNLKKVRSENAKINNYFTDWPTKRPELIKNNNRFIGGYYFNKSKNKNVYLRSSWEYAYALWLNNKNIDWDIEVQQYDLGDGVKYLPDFFIYENGNLVKIVEVKSTFYYTSEDRMKKFYKFQELYKDTFQVEILKELSDILNLNSHASKSSLAREWKKNRILSEEKINVISRI